MNDQVSVPYLASLFWLLNPVTPNGIQDSLTHSKIDVETPLLGPSFSSIYDFNIGGIHQNSIGPIPDCSLVSAYDLAYYISQENIRA
jgi:hypothetical protein